jgi:hypothetical protein
VSGPRGETHSGGYDDFWDMTPCRSTEVCRCFGWTYCLHLQGRRVSKVASDAYTSIPKMEAVRSSETSEIFYRTTRCHIPEDGTLQLFRLWSCRWISTFRRKILLPPSGLKCVGWWIGWDIEAGWREGTHSRGGVNRVHLGKLNHNGVSSSLYTLQSCRWRQHVHPKRLCPVTRLHGITEQSRYVPRIGRTFCGDQ